MYVGLDTELLRFLIKIAAELPPKLKHIVSVYCTLCYAYGDGGAKNSTYFSMVEIAKIYENSTSNRYNNHQYLTLMAIFSGAKLIDLSWERRNKTIYFKIEKIRTTLPKELKEITDYKNLIQKFIDECEFLTENKECD